MPNTIEVQQAPTIQYQTSPNQQQYQQIVIHNFQQNPQVLVSVANELMNSLWFYECFFFYHKN